MPFFFATDHAATELKNHLMAFLKDNGHTVTDLTPDTDPAQHYSEAADRVCQKVLANEGVGILMCGTGQGTVMRANRHKGIRAAMVTNEYLTEMARRHNDANVLVMGARVTTPEIAERLLNIFMNTEFEEGRHVPRVASIDASINDNQKD